MSKHVMWSWALVATIGAGPLVAQDRPVNPFQGGTEDPRQKMIELFKKVETRLGEIDKLLYDAGTGETRLAETPESGIGDLLKSSRKKYDEVLSGIDEILEIAQQQGGGSCSGAMKPGESQSKPQGQPQQGSQQQQAREQTPEKPGESPQKKEPGGKDPQEQPSQAQSEPKGDKESKGDPKNNAGAEPPKLATAVVNADKANEQWGDLPPTVRDLFTTEGGGDLPPQYRDWIDAYYRRLNRERR